MSRKVSSFLFKSRDRLAKSAVTGSPNPNQRNGQSKAGKMCFKKGTLYMLALRECKPIIYNNYTKDRYYKLLYNRGVMIQIHELKGIDHTDLKGIVHTELG